MLYQFEILFLTDVTITPTQNEVQYIYHCNKVRKKEGSGQGWLVKTRVILFKQINLNRCALCAS